MSKLTEFTFHNQHLPVTFVESQTVKKGVTCDIYSFDFDDSRDLAIVRVVTGETTPLQRVVYGTKTIEGYLSGIGTLTVLSNDNVTHDYSFRTGDEAKPIDISVGDIMQWHATGKSSLTFYEICEPPFMSGRFETLPE